MTNLEKLRNATDKEIQILLTQLAYRSTNYNYQDLQVKEWLQEKVKTNYKGEVII